MKRWLETPQAKCNLLQPKASPTVGIMSGNASGDLISATTLAHLNLVRLISQPTTPELSPRPSSRLSGLTWSSVHTDMCSL
ncbi:hypothetical protein L0F63_001995, partial [Massospora cicadina]